ncbi:MAG: hypothetical protein JSR12_06560 [Bacteroidetes bacterium]|nr:hypothetical protein [Bacteroidota bacterium]
MYIDKFFWLKVINYYKEQKIIQNGLTIPFLMGVMNLKYKLPPNKETLRYLIIDCLINTNSKVNPFLQYCSNDEGFGINEYVITTKATDECKADANNIHFVNIKNNLTLCIAGNAKYLGTTKEELINNFWNRYGKYVKKKIIFLGIHLHKNLNLLIIQI